MTREMVAALFALPAVLGPKGRDGSGDGLLTSHRPRRRGGRRVGGGPALAGRRCAVPGTAVASVSPRVGLRRRDRTGVVPNHVLQGRAAALGGTTLREVVRQPTGRAAMPTAARTSPSVLWASARARRAPSARIASNPAGSAASCLRRLPGRAEERIQLGQQQPLGVAVGRTAGRYGSRRSKPDGGTGRRVPPPRPAWQTTCTARTPCFLPAFFGSSTGVESVLMPITWA